MWQKFWGSCATAPFAPSQPPFWIFGVGVIGYICLKQGKLEEAIYRVILGIMVGGKRVYVCFVFFMMSVNIRWVEK